MNDHEKQGTAYDSGANAHELQGRERAPADTTAPLDVEMSGQPRRYCVIDTETSGLFDFSKPADADGQPRLAQFAAILTDDTYAIGDTINMFAKPDGWEIGEEAAAINGLTQDILEEKGIPVAEILHRYNALIDQGFIMVAYNAQFDCKMMRAELRRAGRPDRFEETPNICVMRAAKADMRFPGRPFPKLQVACTHYNVNLERAHEADADAFAAFEIFKALHAKGALPDPKVHYAKHRPE